MFRLPLRSLAAHSACPFGWGLECFRVQTQAQQPPPEVSQQGLLRHGRRVAGVGDGRRDLGAISPRQKWARRLPALPKAVVPEPLAPQKRDQTTLGSQKKALESARSTTLGTASNARICGFWPRFCLHRRRQLYRLYITCPRSAACADLQFPFARMEMTASIDLAEGEIARMLFSRSVLPHR